MEVTYDKEKRRKQKDFLKDFYADYDPRNHDVYVERYNKNVQEFWEKQYRINRGIDKI